jgi:hypothetical protein
MNASGQKADSPPLARRAADPPQWTVDLRLGEPGLAITAEQALAAGY